MLFEFESASGNMYYATHLMLGEFEQRVNGIDVSEDTFNSLLSELREMEQELQQQVLQPSVEIKEPCWVKLRGGSVGYATRNTNTSEPMYPWIIHYDDGYHTVTDRGLYIIEEENHENNEDVVEVGEILTDAELLDISRKGTLQYTGTILHKENCSNDA